MKEGDQVLPTRHMPPEERALVGRRAGTVEYVGRFWMSVVYDFGRVIGLKKDWRPSPNRPSDGSASASAREDEENA